VSAPGRSDDLPRFSKGRADPTAVGCRPSAAQRPNPGLRDDNPNRPSASSQLPELQGHGLRFLRTVGDRRCPCSTVVARTQHGPRPGPDRKLQPERWPCLRAPSPALRCGDDPSAMTLSAAASAKSASRSGVTLGSVERQATPVTAASLSLDGGHDGEGDLRPASAGQHDP
jgi:hypothetical protein